MLHHGTLRGSSKSCSSTLQMPPATRPLAPVPNDPLTQVLQAPAASGPAFTVEPGANPWSMYTPISRHVPAAATPINGSHAYAPRHVPTIDQDEQARAILAMTSKPLRLPNAACPARVISGSPRTPTLGRSGSENPTAQVKDHGAQNKMEKFYDSHITKMGMGLNAPSGPFRPQQYTSPAPQLSYPKGWTSLTLVGVTVEKCLATFLSGKRRVYTLIIHLLSLRCVSMFLPRSNGCTPVAQAPQQCSNPLLRRPLNPGREAP